MNSFFADILRGVASVSLSLLVLPILGLSRRGRGGLKERVGIWSKGGARQFVWFHGASLGEVHGLIPLMKEWRSRRPADKILLTATSTTGVEKGRAYSDEAHLLPLDNPISIRLALRGRVPSSFIFGETELWPTLLSYLHKKGVRIHMVNGRISTKSVARYGWIRPWIVPALEVIDSVCVVSEGAKLRFQKLGVSSHKITVTGNAKYDHDDTSFEEGNKRFLREEILGNSYPVATFGCMRPGEEKIAFPAIKKVIDQQSALNIIIAPRHQEKFSYFAEALREAGISFRTFSSEELRSPSGGVLLLDAMGELARMYQLSDVGVVGGTLLPHYGGHNPFEPAQYQTCVVLGPYGEVIEELREDLRTGNGLIEVTNSEEIESLLVELSKSPEKFYNIGKRSREVWNCHKGAQARIFERITQ